MNYTACLSISQFSTAIILRLIYNSNNHAIIIFLQCSVSFCDYYYYYYYYNIVLNIWNS